MTRLIDADALLEEINIQPQVLTKGLVRQLIANAQTIEADSGEAVAWVLDHTPNKGYMKITHVKEYADKEMSKTKESNPSGFGKEYGCYPYDVCIALYTSPPKREWVELTDEKISLMAFNDDTGDWNDLRFRDCWREGYLIGAKAISAKLKEVNHG